MASRINPRESIPHTARIRAKNQITLPQAVCDAAGLSEGEFLALTVTSKRTMVEPGSIVLAPRQLTEKVWTKAEWAEAEAQADADIKAGRVSKQHKGAGAAIKALRNK